jgi:repressor of nif and glnA expression
MNKNVMSGWKLDAGQKGSRILFRDYHKAIIDTLLEADEPLGSGAVWEAVKERGNNVSRASVIFYLNFLENEKIVKTTPSTGKGGKFKLYKAVQKWEDMKRHIADKIINALGEALDEDLAGII